MLNGYNFFLFATVSLLFNFDFANGAPVGEEGKEVPIANTSISINDTELMVPVIEVPPVPIGKPDDIILLEELAIAQLKSVWTLTHMTYSKGSANTTKGMKKFWYNLKLILGVINDEIKRFDRAIYKSRPRVLLNQVFGLQEYDHLKSVADVETDDPVVEWKIQWIEVSSLCTHIHWLFNKRIRDIMNNVPYIKTIASSLARYYGNPFYSKLSGRKNETHRFPLRDFPRWIDNRIYSILEGDLFTGLRKLIDNCTTCRTGSEVEGDGCEADQSIAKLIPIPLDAPLYVFYYLSQVDIKFYILKNFFHVYREVYENLPYTNYSIFDDRLQTRLRRKLDSFVNAFKDYDVTREGEVKVLPGYFRCDPKPIDKLLPFRSHKINETFIKLTNIGGHFIVREKDMTPSGKCSSTCFDLAQGANNPCRGSDPECRKELYPECDADPSLCENFKPICPLQDTYCYKSAMSATYCPSTENNRLFDWVKLNDNETLPNSFKNDQTCNEPTVTYNATWESGSSTSELCEVCICQCIEPLNFNGNSKTIRYFSQKEAVARVADNRIVVGLKFEQVEDQIHLMIADAVSLPNYKYDPASIVWRKPTRADPANKDEIARIGRNLRALHLDDWKAPPGHVITGVRFIAKAQGTLGSPDYQPYIGLKIMTTKIDKQSGQLDVTTNEWVSDTGSPTKTVYNKYIAPDSPLKTDGPALPDSSVNQLIFFRSTILTKNNENLVIPYFDSQQVVLDENHDVASALRAIGMFQKRKPMFGGFVALKITPYHLL